MLATANNRSYESLGLMEAFFSLVTFYLGHFYYYYFIVLFSRFGIVDLD